MWRQNCGSRGQKVLQRRLPQRLQQQNKQGQHQFYAQREQQIAQKLPHSFGIERRWKRKNHQIKTVEQGIRF